MLTFASMSEERYAQEHTGMYKLSSLVLILAVPHKVIERQIEKTVMKISVVQF